MTPEQATAMYRRRLAPFETIQIRRYTGIGTSKVHFDWEVAARVQGREGAPVVGDVIEHGCNLIALHEDLVDLGFPFPIKTTDVAVVRGKELPISSIDDKTRSVAGVVIAYDIKAGS